MNYPPSIQNLIDEFNKLPGIGQKTSERFVFYLLKKSPQDLERFAKALNHLRDNVSVCSTCYNFSEKNPCAICTDQKRDKSILCVVAESQELLAFEKTGEFNGLYHVLGGVINQVDGIGPEKLRIKELVQRIKKDGIKEIILATNPDLEGESTAIYLTKALKPLGVKISRIGRGLPMGGDIEYADEITLTNALKGRRVVHMSHEPRATSHEVGHE